MHKADYWEERSKAYEDIVDKMEVPLVDVDFVIDVFGARFLTSDMLG